jgi:hypothetical protein
MHRRLNCHFVFILLSMLLIGCNLPLKGSSSTTQPTLTFEPTAILTTAPTKTPSPVATATATAKLPLEAVFLSLVEGGRVAYPPHMPEILRDAPDPSVVCVNDAGRSERLCTPYSWYLTPLSADWLPQGDRLLINDNFRAFKIWTLGGGIKTVLKADYGGFLSDPDWSSDGKTIAYASNLPPRKANEEIFDIFTVNVNNSKVSWITNRQAADSRSPRFSPDGSHLAYISAPILTYPDGTSKPSIYQVTLQDTNDWTKPSIMITTGEEYGLTNNSTLAWSPDGSQILFSGRSLYLINLDGFDVRQVSGTDFGEIRNLTFLPAGQSALVNNNIFVDLVTGDSVTLSYPILTYFMQWVFPTGEAALQTLPEPTCAADWSVLFPGASAYVLGQPGDPPNRVRSGPGMQYEVIYQIYPDTELKVLEGPVCADGLVFWKVENAQIPGGSGWTAEGDFYEYWLWLIDLR